MPPSGLQPTVQHLRARCMFKRPSSCSATHQQTKRQLKLSFPIIPIDQFKGRSNGKARTFIGTHFDQQHVETLQSLRLGSVRQTDPIRRARQQPSERFFANGSFRKQSSSCLSLPALWPRALIGRPQSARDGSTFANQQQASWRNHSREQLFDFPKMPSHNSFR